MTLKNKKIFVGPVEVAGYYHNLCEGFRQLGISYDFITYQSHTYGYGGETKHPRMLQIADWFLRLKNKYSGSILIKILCIFGINIFRQLWGIYAIFHYDIFIFGFGRSLLNKNRDLPILKKLNKKVISNLGHGSDIRPAFIDGFYQSDEGKAPAISEIYNLTKNNKMRIVSHAKYIDILIGAPLSVQFASPCLINLFALGLPFEANQIYDVMHSHMECAYQVEYRRMVRILHSPSHLIGKGSSLIIEAVENLKQRGYLIEFILIKGRPFKDVLKEIQRCDFVVDQLYSDTPMAGFATEAAWFGKPAVVGGYGLDQLKRFVSNGMWPPSKICHPEHIEQAIEELIVDVDQRTLLGRQAYDFVRTKWSAIEVARRYLCLINGNIPDDWWLDPNDIIYLEGCGQSVARSKKTVQDLVAAYGVEALQLSHRPSLERAFLEFAEIISTPTTPLSRS